jgi:hypothetical protein
MAPSPTLLRNVDSLMPTLLKLADQHTADERAAQDAAAAAARAQLATIDATDRDGERLSLAVTKARSKADELRAKLRDAEHALGVASSEHASHEWNRSHTLQTLRRAAVAPYRVQAALTVLAADIERLESSGDWRNGVAGCGEYRIVITRAMQHLRSVADGGADAPADFDTFVTDTLTAAEEARRDAVKAADAQRRVNADAERTRRVFSAA